MSIVFGLCQLYLDCTIVFGFYDCIWIVSIVFGLCQLYLDCVDCIWIVQLPVLVQWGVVLPTPPPPCDKKVVPKRILSIAFGLFRLYLDYVDYIWIVLIVCRPTTLVRRQAGVQECIKGYTWLV